MEGEELGIHRGLLQSATQGDVQAQTILAQDYFFGQNGIGKDLEKGLRWYKLAADQGDKEAQEMVCKAFAYGKGCVQNERTAVEYGEKAAKQGSIKSMELIGKLFFKGTGLDHLSAEVKKQSALRWFKAGAKKGSLSAMVDLADLYRLGHGTKQNYKKALSWYEDVRKELNVIVTADPSKASAQANKTAIAKAFNNLAVMHANGWGTEKNTEVAITYFDTAQGLGHPNAGKNAEALKEQQKKEL